MSKKIFFVTGTRADYGKIKSIIKSLEKNFKIYIFVTGMHLMSKYGSTYQIISKECKNSKIIKFKNQTGHQMLDQIISTTIKGISKNLKKIKPDLVVVHGDRVEAFAAATAASVNNFLVAHIEGGELSGTIDEHLRHAISKLSHIHLVSNNEAKRRLALMGEKKNDIFTVGTPDYDIMKSKDLPKIFDVKKRYGIKFDKFAISIYHSVTTDLKNLTKYCSILSKTLIKSNLKYLVIFPNNDPGSDIILNSILKNFKNNKNFRVIRSMRFEYFLSALKNSSFIIGNSSAGIREAPFFGIPTINIGDRQLNRAKLNSIINLAHDSKKILKAINLSKDKKFKKTLHFGNGNSSNKIVKIFSKKRFWMTPIQKKFTSID
jgi:UDP-N-acetylglucosamine 2-epimerase (hydrolysing)